MAKEVTRTQQVFYVLAENTLSRAKLPLLLPPEIMGGRRGNCPGRSEAMGRKIDAGSYTHSTCIISGGGGCSSGSLPLELEDPDP